MTNRPAYQFQNFEIAAGDSLNAVALGFLALSVRVDNPTGQWYYIPQANVAIPPYTTGMNINFPSGSQVAQVTALTPVGTTSNPLQNQTLRAIFTTNPAPENPGTPSNPLANAGAQELASYGVATDDLGGTVLSSTNLSLLVIANPVQTHILKLRRAFVSLFWDNDGFGEGVLSIGRYSTVPNSDGTLMVAAKMDSADPSSVAIVRASCTGGAIATPIGLFGFSSQNHATEGLAQTSLAFEFLKHTPQQQAKPLTVRPGEVIGIKVANVETSAMATASFEWTEEPITQAA